VKDMDDDHWLPLKWSVGHELQIVTVSAKKGKEKNLHFFKIEIKVYVI
jgi:hypothetical protein